MCENCLFAASPSGELPYLAIIAAAVVVLFLSFTMLLVSRYKRGFPRSLDGAPFLLPLPATALRRSLDAWFDAEVAKSGNVPFPCPELVLTLAEIYRGLEPLTR